jgi:small GTP-binding protein
MNQASNKTTTKEAVAKLLIIGDSRVGKSSILTRFTENFFSQHTIMTVGIDYKTKKITVDGCEIKLQIWDTAGQERYRSITQNFYKNTMGVIVVFDLTDEASFENVRNWLRQIKTHAGENVCKILVGNKCDMPEARAVARERIDEFAKEIDIEYFEASAKNNENIAEAFTCISKTVKDKFFATLRTGGGGPTPSGPQNGGGTKLTGKGGKGDDDVRSGRCC